jgi:hypothetical protein
MAADKDPTQCDRHPLPAGDWTVVGVLRRRDVGPVLTSADERLRIRLELGGRLVWQLGERVHSSPASPGEEVRFALRRRGGRVELYAAGERVDGWDVGVNLDTVLLMRTQSGARRDFTVYGLALPDERLSRGRAAVAAA